ATLSISQSPTDPAASIPALSSTYANGVMSWAAPSDQYVSATVRVRREDQVNFVDIEATRQGGNFNADLLDELAQAGNYRYEIVYTRTVNGAQVIIAKNSGQL